MITVSCLRTRTIYTPHFALEGNTWDFVTGFKVSYMLYLRSWCDKCICGKADRATTASECILKHKAHCPTIRNLQAYWIYWLIKAQCRTYISESFTIIGSNNHFPLSSWFLLCRSSEQVPPYFELVTEGHNSVKLESKYYFYLSQNCTKNCRLQNDIHFGSDTMS